MRTIEWSGTRHSCHATKPTIPDCPALTKTTIAVSVSDLVYEGKSTVQSPAHLCRMVDWLPEMPFTRNHLQRCRPSEAMDNDMRSQNRTALHALRLDPRANVPGFSRYQTADSYHKIRLQRFTRQAYSRSKEAIAMCAKVAIQQLLSEVITALRYGLGIVFQDGCSGSFRTVARKLIELQLVYACE